MIDDSESVSNIDQKNPMLVREIACLGVGCITIILALISDWQLYTELSPCILPILFPTAVLGQFVAFGSLGNTILPSHRHLQRFLIVVAAMPAVILSVVLSLEYSFMYRYFWLRGAIVLISMLVGGLSLHQYTASRLASEVEFSMDFKTLDILRQTILTIVIGVGSVVYVLLPTLYYQNGQLP